MIYLIPIDRSTFRKNPDAGRTEWRTPGVYGAEVVIKTSQYEAAYASLGPIEVSEDELRITSRWVLKSTNGMPEQLIDYNEPHTFDLNGPTISAMLLIVAGGETVRSIRPAPAYLFEYSAVEVQCSECGAKFLNTELEEDDIGDCFVDRICPKCRDPFCCELEYESPDVVATEMKL